MKNTIDAIIMMAKVIIAEFLGILDDITGKTVKATVAAAKKLDFDSLMAIWSVKFEEAICLFNRLNASLSLVKDGVYTLNFYHDAQGKLSVWHGDVYNGWLVIWGNETSIEHISIEVHDDPTDQGHFVTVSKSRYVASPAEQRAQQLLHLDADQAAFRDLHINVQHAAKARRKALRRLANAFIEGNTDIPEMHRDYCAFGHGANAANRGTLKLCRKDIAADIDDYCHHGCSKTAPVVMAKWAAYGGQNLTFRRPFPLPINPEDILVVPSFHKVFNVWQDYVDPATQTVKRVKRDIDLNAFDGQGEYFVTEEYFEKATRHLDEEQKLFMWQLVCESTNGSMKGLMAKGFLHHTAAPWQQAFIDAGITKVNGKSINQYVMLVDESVMKATYGENGQYSDWAAYCKAVHENQQWFGRVVEHADSHENHLPSQQIREMSGCDMKYIAEGARKEAAYINQIAAHPERLLNGMMKEIYNIDPNIMTVPAVADMVRVGYNKLYLEGAGAKKHNASRYNFVAADPVAFISHATQCFGGKNEVEYGLAEHTAYCRANKYRGEVIISRNPCSDVAALRPVFLTCEGALDKYVRSDDWTVFISIQSLEITALDGDFDGDGVNVCYERWFYNAIVDRNNKLGYGVITVWPSSKAAKVKYDTPEDFDAARIAYYESIDVNAGIGIGDNKMSKLASAGRLDKTNASLCAWMINANVDQGKGQATAEKIRDSAFAAELSAVGEMALPLYKMYDHASQECGSKPDWTLDEYAKRTDGKYELADIGKSPCDLFSRIVRDRCVSEIMSHDDAMMSIDEFDVRLLMLTRKHVNGERNKNGMPCNVNIAGLFRQSAKPEDRGVWQMLNEKRRRDLKCCDMTHSVERTNFRAQRAAAMRGDIQKWLDAQNEKRIAADPDAVAYTFDDAYDCITAHIFAGRVKQYELLAWIDVFTPECKRALELNTNVKLNSVVSDMCAEDPDDDNAAMQLLRDEYYRDHPEEMIAVDWNAVVDELEEI